MIMRLLRSAALAVVAVVLTGVPAWARHDNDRVVIVGNSRPRNVIVVREVRSPRVIVVRDRFGGRPYGWDRGRKVGWGDCDLPPGLARKYGCRQNSYPRNRRIDRRRSSLSRCRTTDK